MHCGHFQCWALCRGKRQHLGIHKGKLLLPHAFEVHGAHQGDLAEWWQSTFQAHAAHIPICMEKRWGGGHMPSYSPRPEGQVCVSKYSKLGLLFIPKGKRHNSQDTVKPSTFPPQMYMHLIGVSCWSMLSPAWVGQCWGPKLCQDYATHWWQHRWQQLTAQHHALALTGFLAEMCPYLSLSLAPENSHEMDSWWQATLQSPLKLIS